MLVFLDTNILISAALNPLWTPGEAFDKAVASPNRAVICQQNVEELHRVFEMKLPAKMYLLDDFLRTMESSLEVVPVPEVEATSEVDIRDACAHAFVIKSDVFVSIHFKRRDKSGISRRSFLRRTAVILRQD